MSSTSDRKYKAFKADGVIAQYAYVKMGSDREHVVLCGAAEKAIGVAQVASAAAEDVIEVALLGGGALLKINATLAAGVSLASDAAGLAVAPAAGEWSPAILMDGGVAGDVKEVLLEGHYTHA